MNSKITKRLLKIGVLLMLLSGLIAGIAFPAYAGNDSNPKTSAFRIIQGKVASIDDASDSFKLVTANNEEVNIITNSSTQFFVIPSGKVNGAINSLRSPLKNEVIGKGNLKPNPAARLKETKKLQIPANWRINLGWLAFFDNPADFEDIEVNDRVIVRADSDNLARQVLIIKAPVIRTIKGSVSLLDSTHIKITPADNDPITLNVVSDTSIVLHGQTSISGYAVAVYNSSTGNALKVNVYSSAPSDD
jgi:hypothetical protein